MAEEQPAHIPNESEEEEIDPLSDPDERRVLYAALDAFRQYRQAAHFNITHLRRQSFYSLPSAHMSLLSAAPFNLNKTFDAVDAAIDANADISDAILEVGLASYGIPPENTEWKGTATASDMDKARSTIRQFYRDWSMEGAAEREACYGPILAALNRSCAHLTPAQRSHTHVLVPGAGLGRLVFEVNRAGYAVEGNEISYHQLFASNWILNHTRAAGAHDLHPWALSFSNHTHRAHQLQKIAIPDVHPGTALAEASERLRSEIHAYERMSMASGDFCVLYKSPEYSDFFDAVTTCFFIDTAPNLIAYIETVRHCLRSGGVWINLGPLLWHFESGSAPGSNTPGREKSSSSNQNRGIGEAGSFELADEEVVELLRHFGFDVVEHEPIGVETGYIQDPRSMLQYIYKPSFWMARKK
ncbi:N2227-like protein-domain-containing protein [Delphinella strobiligena]|nr:N2227-like protein-domain-containing protein [Delphinella strobiligena]